MRSNSSSPLKSGISFVSPEGQFCMSPKRLAAPRTAAGEGLAEGRAERSGGGAGSPEASPGGTHPLGLAQPHPVCLSQLPLLRGLPVVLRHVC